MNQIYSRSNIEYTHKFLCALLINPYHLPTSEPIKLCDYFLMTQTPTGANECIKPWGILFSSCGLQVLIRRKLAPAKRNTGCVCVCVCWGTRGSEVRWGWRLNKMRCVYRYTQACSVVSDHVNKLIIRKSALITLLTAANISFFSIIITAIKKKTGYHLSKLIIFALCSLFSNRIHDVIPTLFNNDYLGWLFNEMNPYKTEQQFPMWGTRHKVSRWLHLVVTNCYYCG